MLKYQPKEGSVVFCDFKGFIAPEMIKERRVIVIRQHPENSQLVTVVPISTTAPFIVKDYHYLIDERFSLEYFKHPACWVKCDMVYVVSLERLRHKEDEFGEVQTIEFSSKVMSLLKLKIGMALGIIGQSEGAD